MKKKDTGRTAAIPMRTVGPVRITGPVLNEEVMVPLATFETPLWPSVARGAKAGRAAGGISVVVADQRMTRSLLVQAPSAADAVRIADDLKEHHDTMAGCVESSSRFARLLNVHSQIVGDQLYLRVEIDSGDASGHNMATQAAECVLDWLLRSYPGLRHVSLSGNYCTDKKVSAVNGILGRGRNVIAEAVLPAPLCRRYLRTTPDELDGLNTAKNLLGSIVAGGVRSANAHFANMLLAFYLATGQDAANIVEGSQGFTRAEARAEGLYFSVTVPHVIVGSVGHGKQDGHASDNLRDLGCLASRRRGENARRLAAIAGAVVWCGELSLMAALTQRGELMAAHRLLERRR